MFSQDSVRFRSGSPDDTHEIISERELKRRVERAEAEAIATYEEWRIVTDEMQRNGKMSETLEEYEEEMKRVKYVFLLFRSNCSMFMLGSFTRSPKKTSPTSQQN
jgi:hypothetical protein